MYYYVDIINKIKYYIYNIYIYQQNTTRHNHQKRISLKIDLSIGERIGFLFSLFTFHYK